MTDVQKSFDEIDRSKNIWINNRIWTILQFADERGDASLNTEKRHNIHLQ